MIRKAGLWFLLLSVVLAVPAGAIRYSLLESSDVTPEMLAMLLRDGPMIMTRESEDGRLQLVTSGILIDAPPEQVWAAITDYEHFSEFMPSTEGCRVLSREGNVSRVWFHIKFSFSVLSYAVRYTLRQHFEGTSGIWWEMESGDLNNAIGSWELIPLDGGRKCAAMYSVYSDIRSIGRLVRYFIDREPSMDVAINTSTCVLVLKAVRTRVESGAYAHVTGAQPAAPEEPPASEPQAGEDADTGS